MTALKSQVQWKVTTFLIKFGHLDKMWWIWCKIYNSHLKLLPLFWKCKTKMCKTIYFAIFFDIFQSDQMHIADVVSLYLLLWRPCCDYCSVCGIFMAPLAAPVITQFQHCQPLFLFRCDLNNCTVSHSRAKWSAVCCCRSLWLGGIK